MTYQLHTECPIWERPEFINGMPQPLPAGSTALRWTALFDPPKVGELIRITMNSCGPAVVTGYFEEGGYLGIRCTLLDPPKWHKEQNEKGPHGGHVFGAEIEPLAPAADKGEVTLTWRQHPAGPAFRAYQAPKALGYLIEAAGFGYEGNHACWMVCKYQQGAEIAFALAARLQLAGYTVTHAGCHGPAGPPAQGGIAG